MTHYPVMSDMTQETCEQLHIIYCIVMSNIYEKTDTTTQLNKPCDLAADFLSSIPAVQYQHFLTDGLK